MRGKEFIYLQKEWDSAHQVKLILSSDRTLHKAEILFDKLLKRNSRMRWKRDLQMVFKRKF